MVGKPTDPSGMSYEAAGRRLGLTKQRIQQLRAQGRLPSLAPDALDAFERDRKSKDKAKAEFYESRKAALEARDQREFAFWEAMIAVAQNIDRNLSLLVAATAAGVVTDATVKRGKKGI